MSSNAIILRQSSKMRNLLLFKRSFTTGKIVYNQQPTATSAVRADVPGLSRAVCDVPNEPVGPGAAKNTDYKNPEYFSYDKNSYFEAEVEMAKYRCPQPSTKVYYKPSSQ